MPTITTPKTLTIRLTSEQYATAQKIAQQREISLNTLVQESLSATFRAEEERQRFNDYTLLGQDEEMCEIEYAIHAQAEVMLDAHKD